MGAKAAEGSARAAEEVAEMAAAAAKARVERERVEAAAVEVMGGRVVACTSAVVAPRCTLPSGRRRWPMLHCPNTSSRWLGPRGRTYLSMP